MSRVAHAARVAVSAIFLPQTRIQAEGGTGGQFLGQGGVQGVQSLDDDDTAPGVDARVPLGLVEA